jgi:hypothetical protein
VPTLVFETDPADICEPTFGGPTDVVVHFLSLAFATRYGSIHPLSQLALLLRGPMKIDLGPLTTFADRNVEEPEDAVELERVWQDAQPLALCIPRVVEALESGDERVVQLTEDAPDLPARLSELGRAVECAAAAGARVRLSYNL